SHLAGRSVDGDLEILAAQRLPHSLGLLYEEVTDHLGFRRSSDEYKVMALAAYGKPAFIRELREAVRPTGDGGFTVAPIELDTLAKRRGKHEEWTGEHADLAASVQLRLEEVLLELVRWLHAQTGDRDLTMAGGVALNCVANSVLATHGPFERIWVQPAAGDAGTALGAALHVAHALGDRVAPMPTAALGRGCPRGDRRRRRGRLVPGPQRVRPPRPRPPQPARQRHPRGQPGAPQRRQGPRAVPPGGPDGPGRAGRRALRGAHAQPLHALHSRGPAG